MNRRLAILVLGVEGDAVAGEEVYYLFSRIDVITSTTIMNRILTVLSI